MTGAEREGQGLKEMDGGRQEVTKSDREVKGSCRDRQRVAGTESCTKADRE